MPLPLGYTPLLVHHVGFEPTAHGLVVEMVGLAPTYRSSAFELHSQGRCSVQLS